MPHEQYKSCIEACNACAAACDHCAASCLQEDDVKMMARCIALDIDCAAICRLAAGYMARGSELASAVCNACAQVCESCAEECARHTKMEHCRQCAEACRRCAQECRRMASMAGAGRQPAHAADPATAARPHGLRQRCAASARGRHGVDHRDGDRGQRHHARHSGRNGRRPGRAALLGQPGVFPCRRRAGGVSGQPLADFPRQGARRGSRPSLNVSRNRSARTTMARPENRAAALPSNLLT